jgi:hypothetical protein
MSSDRIDKTEKEIQEILPAKPEYVVTTSEYGDVRERLIAREARRKAKDDDRPVLRVRPGDGKAADDPSDVDPSDVDSSGDRPTLKRHDLSE